MKESLLQPDGTAETKSLRELAKHASLVAERQDIQRGTQKPIAYKLAADAPLFGDVSDK